MDINIDNIKRLIDQVRTISFWGRLFRWIGIKQLVLEAATDLQKFVTTASNLQEQYNELKNDRSLLAGELELTKRTLIIQAKEVEDLKQTISLNNNRITQYSADIAAKIQTIENAERRIIELDTDNKLLIQKNEQLEKSNKKLGEDAATSGENVNNLSKRKAELDLEVLGLKKDLQATQQEVEELKEKNTQFVSNEENRKIEHANAVSTLNSIQQEIKATRDKEIEDRHLAELNHLENLKNTWSNHQDCVKQAIKAICNKHIIEYVDKVPFKGDPDNTLKISDEFIIFDAKSPRGEDLKNFPRYLKEQVESAKKYAKLESVKKWIFLVVPHNTLESIDTYVHHLADYDVFIISADALEPVILSLKKIEDYDFAEQLSPEERENICRVLGKFAHLTKRRIQIDTFFIKQFIELAYKAESDLPKEFLDKVVEFEKAEKLNPPTERRSKQISLKDLEKDTAKLRNETSTKGIAVIEDVISIALNNLPLYSDTENNGQ
ncbi:MAG TPA: hypothetical protein VHB48_06050 [Chitinophagaceae bacterium]|nr:hypothetical protein [Chitinophagaceae bacterium]